MKINLHIDRLILDGVNIRPGQRHLLQASVEAELARLLMEGGISPNLTNGGAVPGVPAKAIQLGSQKELSNSSVQIGRQIAQSVYGGIGK
jgi:hypothetical protein